VRSTRDYDSAGGSWSDIRDRVHESVDENLGTGRGWMSSAGDVNNL